MKRYYLICIIIATVVLADDNYGESQNGLTHPFFGYKKLIEVKKDNNETKKSIVIPKDLDQMSSDELQTLIKESSKIATAFQTKENISNYIKIQNYAMNKADTFQRKWKKVVLEDSSLDLSAPISKGTFARNATTAQKAKDRDQFWKENMKNIVLVSFFDKNDEEKNVAQNRVLYFIQKDYPELLMKKVFIQNHKKLADKHGVLVTPDLFMVYKKQWHRVKAGMSSKDEILNNIDFVYSFIKEEEEEL